MDEPWIERPTMKILVTGATGFLGWNAVRYLRDRRHDVVATYHESLSHYLHSDGRQLVRLEITDETSVQQVLARVRPEIVIHAAALAGGGHRDAGALHRSNVVGSRNIARRCTELGIRLIHISTDLVFPRNAGRCCESTPIADEPQNAYARSKVEAERVVATEAPSATVIRPSVLYGPTPEGRTSFTEFLTRHWSRGEAAPLLIDQRRSFLFVDDLLDAIERVGTSSTATGPYVCGGSEALSRYEFGLRYARHLGVDPSLCRPLSSDQLDGYPSGASSIELDTAKLEALGWQPTPLEASFARF